MPAKTLEEARQVLIDSLPATGDVSYEAYYNDLMSRNERLAIAEFHRERRAGTIAAELKPGPDGIRQLFVSRPTT